MIPTLEQVVGAYELYRRRHQLAFEPNRISIRAALAMATRLATQEADEPAALFYAFGRYPRAFPGAWRDMTQLFAANRAAQLGSRIPLNDELGDLLIRVTSDHVSYEEVRDWFAARRK